jgi:plastocyanin
MMKSAVLVLALALASGLPFSGCSKSNPASPSSGSGNLNATTVTMPNFTFSPANLTIAKHTTVTWYNNSGIAHTSTSDDGLWDTGNIAAGVSKTTTFDSAGTFHYHCIYHAAMGMVGTITVQ